jgi:hypothetical protein
MSQIVHGANAELGSAKTSKSSGLLVVAMESFIPCGPSVIAVGPDEGNDATGPTTAMVVGCQWDVVSMQVRGLQLGPKDRPSTEEELLPADIGLTDDQGVVLWEGGYWRGRSVKEPMLETTDQQVG